MKLGAGAWRARESGIEGEGIRGRGRGGGKVWKIEGKEDNGRVQEREEENSKIRKGGRAQEDV